MKRTILTLTALLVIVSLAACGKSHTCRCSVLHEQTIRIVEIDKGDCHDIRFVYYDEDELNPNMTDSVLCIDYELTQE